MEEILHQLIWRIHHYLQGFIHLKWCRISSSKRIISTILGFGDFLCGSSVTCCFVQGEDAKRPTRLRAATPAKNLGFLWGNDIMGKLKGY